MQELSTLKINDIFWSFQGEGSRSGVPSIFIRLAGCSLKCPYCDQIEAWTSGKRMTVPEIIEEVVSNRAHAFHSQVVLTGGEPQEQDLEELALQLKKKDIYLAIETNGAHYQKLPIDWWTVSPKDENNYTIHPELIPNVNEIKLVVNDHLDLDVVRQVRSTLARVPIFLQPDVSDPQKYEKAFLLFKQCQDDSLDNIRCGIQMHAIYDVK